MRVRRVAVAAGAAALLAGTGLAVAVPAGAESLAVTPTGHVVVSLRGNGHGHGMSQYGAEGAALAGKTTAQILAFYYQGTTLKKVGAPTIRVLLSGTGTTTTVGAYSVLSVTGVRGYLPTTGIARYRLVADAKSGITLQQLGTAKGAVWTTTRTGLPNGAEFRRANGSFLRLYLPGGYWHSTFYYGGLRAVRGSGGVYTVNDVDLDSYTAGVTPREMPASWRRAAVDAQAVAARSYGYYAVTHRGTGQYDICDTSSCQVYGGMESYDTSGHLAWTDDRQAATDTAGQVLTYKNAAVFAQYSASNGGWTVDGGQPYLTAQADPYDAAGGADPYTSYSRTVTASSLARAFGLATLTKLTVTKRDGHGTWGGRITAATAYGTDSHGKAATVAISGYQLQYALGVGTTWIYLSRATT